MTTHVAIKKQPLDEKALDRLIAARTTLVLEHPFYGSIALRLKLVEDRTIPTLATDAVHIIYNPDYLNQLTDQEVVFAVAHEASHCVAGHCWRRAGRDPRRWNVACDYAINPLLMMGGFVREQDFTKRGWLLNKAYHGMSAEAIYEQLPKSPSGGGKGKGKGQGGQGDDDDPNGGAFDEIRDAANPVEAEAEWKVAAAQAVKIAKMMGNLPAGIESFVDELVKPRLPWRELLRRFAHQVKLQDYTFRRPNRRYIGNDIYLPSIHGEAVPPMVVVIDTSGSTSEHQEQFGAEMKAVVEEVLPEKTHVIYCDCKVEKVAEFERGEFVTEHFKGNGGTSFVPPFEYVEKEGIEPACLIYLTDLEGTFPEPPPYPTLWVSTTDHVAPFGETIQMD